MNPGQYEPARTILWHISRVRLRPLHRANVGAVAAVVVDAGFGVIAAVAVVAVAAAALMTAGCMPADPGFASDCPDDVPAACPSPAPTFSGDGGVAAVIAARCASCHPPQAPPLQTYDQLSLPATTQGILMQIHTCLMPPAGQTPLTSQERQVILGWLVCGSPND
jgi:hypothetical protein